MDRRTFITGAGTVAAGTAGCLGGGSSETPVPDSDPDDGYPAASVVGSAPDSRDVETSSFETLRVGDVDVPLVPVDVAHYWFQRREARFADARGEGSYDEAHVTGAVLSSARRVQNWAPTRDDPTADWPPEDRIVCYCRCPHHLSSLRAGEFITKGYESVYAIDEGFGAWLDSGYPTTGSATNASYVVRGRADPADAGGYAWATHRASDQREAAPIADDGSYELTLRFAGLTASAPIHLRTPSYELTAPLSELTASVVTGAE